jgi:hypothetical protein
MAISEKKLKKIVNESVEKVLNERNYHRLTENVLGFYISKETFDEIKMGNEPDVVLINHLYEELAGPDCIHFVSRLIIKKIRGEM